MRNTKKKTTKSKTYKRPNQLSETELRRKYNSWMNHFTYGATQITELPKETQIYLLGVLLQQTLYNQTTNPLWSEMYKHNLYPYETDMEDTKLLPLIKKKLENSMEDLITTGCRRKFVGVLNSIDKTYNTGEYL
jgi:hypothetical protein